MVSCKLSSIIYRIRLGLILRTQSCTSMVSSWLRVGVLSTKSLQMLMTSFVKHPGLELAKKLQTVFQLWKKKESKNYLPKKLKKYKIYQVNKFYRIEDINILPNIIVQLYFILSSCNLPQNSEFLIFACKKYGWCNFLKFWWITTCVTKIIKSCKFQYNFL